MNEILGVKGLNNPWNPRSDKNLCVVDVSWICDVFPVSHFQTDFNGNRNGTDHTEEIQ